jgi:hypothetical protein
MVESRKSASTSDDSISASSDRSWARAREILESCEPVIPPIRRICETTIGDLSKINPIREGAIIPLRKIVLACGQDSILASGAAGDRARASAREVLETIPSDVIAAALVLHSVSRRVSNRHLEAIWGTFLDEALNRAAIGYAVGRGSPEFGAGRAMLAGFSSRAGLAMIVAHGSEEQAARLLQGLRNGATLRDTCLIVYQVDPVHVGALVVLAAGCGPSACMGIRGCADFQPRPPEDEAELLWWGTHLLIDQLATRELQKISPILWDIVGIKEESAQKDVFDFVQSVSRGEHSWSWLLEGADLLSE